MVSSHISSLPVVQRVGYSRQLSSPVCAAVDTSDGFEPHLNSVAHISTPSHSSQLRRPLWFLGFKHKLGHAQYSRMLSCHETSWAFPCAWVWRFIISYDDARSNSMAKILMSGLYDSFIYACVWACELGGY
eukprot:GHVS01039353.1.p1 GENE.GHVS01039353.1~~GHVS01039353.1.p1  ORF type:complete len:131 (+),score=0.17 GHVS01039353.1:195-587(+)